MSALQVWMLRSSGSRKMPRSAGTFAHSRTSCANKLTGSNLINFRYSTSSQWVRSAAVRSAEGDRPGHGQALLFKAVTLGGHLQQARLGAHRRYRHPAAASPDSRNGHGTRNSSCTSRMTTRRVSERQDDSPLYLQVCLGQRLPHPSPVKVVVQLSQNPLTHNSAMNGRCSGQLWQPVAKMHMLHIPRAAVCVPLSTMTHPW